MLKITLTSLLICIEICGCASGAPLRFRKPGVHKTEERGSEAELWGRSTSKACAKTKTDRERDQCRWVWCNQIRSCLVWRGRRTWAIVRNHCKKEPEYFSLLYLGVPEGEPSAAPALPKTLVSGLQLSRHHVSMHCNFIKGWTYSSLSMETWTCAQCRDFRWDFLVLSSILVPWLRHPGTFLSCQLRQDLCI